MYEVYGMKNCSYCTKAKQLLEQHGIDYDYYLKDEDFTTEIFVERFPGVKTLPYILVDGNPIGGFDNLQLYLASVKKEV